MLILFFSFVLLIKSQKDCAFDDYLCIYVNRIEKRWFHPQNNFTNTFSNEINNLTKQVENFSISMNSNSNTSFVIRDDKSIDLRSALVPSVLISKADDHGGRQTTRWYKRIIQIFSKSIYPVNQDFQNGWKIDGQKGKLTFRLKTAKNLSKIAVYNLLNLNCSIKQFDILILNEKFEWNKVASYNLSKGIKSIQEFPIPGNQTSPVFRIEITDNYNDSFTCFNQPFAFEY